jgi:hypothetical protein
MNNDDPGLDLGWGAVRDVVGATGSILQAGVAFGPSSASSSRTDDRPNAYTGSRPDL